MQQAANLEKASGTAARVNMVLGQILTNNVLSPPLLEAIAKTPREDFVPEHLRHAAFMDEDLPLGNGRWLLSPLVFARMAQIAEADTASRVLLLADGYGYGAGVFSRLCHFAVSCESDPRLSEQAKARLSAAGCINARAVQASDLTEGCIAYAPYDAILILGAVEYLPPHLADQLTAHGKIIAVEGRGRTGRIVSYTRSGNSLMRKEWFDAFAPRLPDFQQPSAFVF